MNPTFDLKGEHTAIAIILDAMKKMALDIRNGKHIDSYRIVQIIDFLHTYNENCHYEKEEKCLYPALLDFNIPWTAESIDHLNSEHKIAHVYIHEIDHLFEEYLSGNSQSLISLSLSMMKYVELEENHIKIVDSVVLPLCERLFDNKKQLSVSLEFKKIQDHNVGHDKHLEYFRLLSKIYSENEVNHESVYL